MDEAVALGRLAIDQSEQHQHSWWLAAASAALGETVLASGDTATAVVLLERGVDRARAAGMEAYLLRCLAPLAAATGSARCSGRSGKPAGARRPARWARLDARLRGYLSLARAWLGHREPVQARQLLAPLLAVAEREPWTRALAAALVVDASALIQLGNREQAASRLDRAEELARTHELPHVLHEAAAARRLLR